MDFVEANDDNATSTNNEISIDELQDTSVDMISQAQNPNVLLPQYKNAHLDFVTGIKYLNYKYRMLRRVRGDGNCFYRSCFFGYLEGLLSKYTGDDAKNKEDAIIEKNRILKIITESKEELIQYGYSEIAIESFYDIVIEVLENLFTTMTHDELLNSFQASGLSDYYTWYMRLLTSLSMKKNVDRYLPFIDDVDMNSYCLREVEPMGKEVEHMMVEALSEYLGIKLKIEYLDGKPFEKELSSVLFNAVDGDEEFDVVLLYRPGHYDILYK